MVPIKLQLHNFLSYREPAPLDFTNFNLAVLSGNNGVGKSSILEAITWAIWGQTRAGSDDDLIHQGKTDCWVEFIFEHEGSLYRIVRKREIKRKNRQSFLELQTKSKKSSTLLDDNYWQSISEATLKVTQEKIIKILKIPYEIFVNSSYLRQGHADEFTIKTPAERKEILSDVLSLNYYEELSCKAREVARQLEEKEKLFTFQIEDLKKEIARKKEVENEFLKIEKEYQKNINHFKKLKGEIENLDKQNKEYEITHEKLNILRQQFTLIKQEAQDLNEERRNYLKEQNYYQDQLKNKDKILIDYNDYLKLEKKDKQENLKFQKQAIILQDLKGIEQLKEKLENDVGRIKKISICPICRRPMKKNEAVKIVKHLNRDFQQKFGPKLRTLQQDLEKINYNSLKHQKIQEKLIELTKVRQEKQALDLAENNLKNILSNLKRIGENFQKIKKEAKKISHDGKLLKEKLPKLEKANLVWQEKKGQEKILEETMLNLQNKMGGLKQELIQIQNQEKELRAIEKNQEKAQKENTIYQELSNAFGKKGIQAMIIEQSLIVIEESTNDLLKKITNGRMRMRFITQKAKKATTAEDELIETLEIKIADELGERDYEMYSGGEAFRINFAIRIALSKLLAARAGTHLKFLAIDEGFGMLDVAGRDDIVAAINSIAGDFEKIIAITHLQELKDLFPTKIEITKDENGSQIKVVG